MRLNDRRKYTTAGGAVFAVALSSLLLAGCSSDPEAPASAPAASASASPSAPASPTAPSASGSPSAPPSPAPAVQTHEDARKIIADYHENNADLTYTVFDNGDGTFDVKVTSVSIAAQGGTGTTGLYVVEQNGSFALK